jgi:hypothetical protein
VRNLAYFDRNQRLCMIGIDTDGPVRTLSSGVYRFTIAARLLGVCSDEAATIAVTVATPSGVRLLDTHDAAQT